MGALSANHNHLRNVAEMFMKKLSAAKTDDEFREFVPYQRAIVRAVCAGVCWVV